VRALPTWRNPVGEGAKRTRKGRVAEEAESGIVRLLSLTMLKHRPVSDHNAASHSDLTT
jgi:hypothetical protein